MSHKYTYLIIIILILLSFIIHQSFLLKISPALNLWPALLTFILFIFGYRLALIWGISLGFLMDTFSSLPFGVYLLILFLIILSIYLLTKHLITHRSILSLLIISFTAVILHNLLLYTAHLLIGQLASADYLALKNFSQFLLQIFANLLLTIIMLGVTLKFTNRLKTNFIDKKNTL